MSTAHAAQGAKLSVENLFDLSNHVVLVTGGATGIGEMAAQAFIENGARVLIASRKESQLKTTAARLNALGPGKCEYVVADLKDKAGCVALCEEVKRRTSRLSVLINNSGATWGGDYYDFPENGWDKIMALNVKSIFYVTAGLEKLLTAGATAAKPNAVINVASMAGISTADVTSGDEGGLSAPGHGVYSYGPSKAACIHLTRIQASKLMPLHVTANVICPGVFPSLMTQFGMQKFGDALVAGQPSGRVGVPGDIAGTVLFLGSAGAAHFTGNVLELDGGATRSGGRGRRQKKEKL